jgi:acyl carrier protein
MSNNIEKDHSKILLMQYAAGKLPASKLHELDDLLADSMDYIEVIGGIKNILRKNGRDLEESYKYIESLSSNIRRKLSL